MASEAASGEKPKASEPTPAMTVWLAPLVSAALLYGAFFPLAWAPLAWVALMPLLCLVRTAGRPRRVYLAAWVGGLAFFMVVLQWMRVADPRMYITWIALALACSLFIPPALALVRRLDRRTSLPLLLTFPAVWVSFEYLRSGFLGGFVTLVTGSHHHDVPGGFAWYFLGHTQHDVVYLIQVADLAGAYGVSFLLCAVNAVLFEMLYSWARFRRWLGLREPEEVRPGVLLGQGLLIVLGVGAVLAYGNWRLQEDTVSPGPRIALLQGNVDQRLRILSFHPTATDSDKAREDMAEHYERLALLAARQRPDLMIWPETSYPGTWVERQPGEPAAHSARLAQNMGRVLRTPQLLGMNAGVVGPEDRKRAYNSAIHLDREGRWLGRYDKVHRVPFGEYIPLRSLLPILEKLAPYDYDYSVMPGEEFTRFHLQHAGRSYVFGAVICYEDTDPTIARAYLGSDSKERVDFLVNISNDGWFNGTSEHDQHLAIARFRAVECRRSLVRAVNMGISAVIDSTGRVLAPRAARAGDFRIWEIPADAGALPVPRWREFKQSAGVLLAAVPIDTRSSLYAAWGDWFAWACAMVTVVGLLTTVRWRRGALS